MYPLNDNDLDRLSRDAADQYDVESSTSGWEALENRLNKELPLKEEKERRRFLFWLFLIVLLAGAGLLWMMTGKNNPTIQMAHTEGTDGTAIPAQQDTKNTTPAANQPSPNVGIPQQDAAKPAPTDDVPALAAVTPSTGATAQQQQTTPASPGHTDNPTASTPAAKNSKFSAGLPSTTYNTRPKANHTSGKKKGGRQDGESVVADNQNNQPLQHKLTNPKIHGQDAAQDDDLLRASLVTSAGIKAGDIGPIKAPPLPVPAADSTAAEKTPPKKKEQPSKGFEIGLVAGPDMSNVKFTDMDKVGYNVGIQIGYRFSDRWSANTGLLYTRKNYTAEGKDWTKTGWWRYTDIHSVQGYCQMFEIPLNVRYDISVNKNQRWFVNAGASSYIMNSEYYDYDYTYNGTRYQRGWDRDSTSTYLFSILNLSAGFERALNKRFTIQAEPYFKFPLKGLGYGKLDLNSYGIYFSLKYKLGK
ncbi:outer membrane beta-barrel protein [Pseudoflavitalea sp. X16]|uniref:porin family protein n=1 Tax=Paraflavitalea devenefica TaxID=2716334 RepID=UPI0014203F97|nr:porin family protein [Paraflavitalea devenefica]NII27739.1 outer membrane beta-barrel protein [Paraflavitalea devenefica]